MLSSLKIRNQLLILFISGVLAGFSIYSIYLTPLLILGYCYFLKKLEINRTKKNAFYDGVIFGTGYFFGCLHWIVFFVSVCAYIDSIVNFSSASGSIDLS